ncbi:hypothetical protein [Acidaminococcus timonensis]|uniref:hypothetical protein n=1 Tax=Acidaminococcus timonensis TaxID=1871002 RepID=UPI003079A037
MFPKIAVVKKAVQSLYDATATVSTWKKEKDASNITREKLQQLGETRCRVVYRSVPAVQGNDMADLLPVEISMNYDAEALNIPPGSRIHIKWDDGREEDFQNSSFPAVYLHHGSVQLERVGRRP